MFCELVGSITLAGILDPKDLHRVIASYPPRMGDTTALFERFVAQGHGDSAHPCDNQF